VLVVFLVVAEVQHVALPAMRAYGVGFMTGTVWDANRRDRHLRFDHPGLRQGAR